MFQKDQRKTPSVPGYNLHLLMKSFLGMGVYFLFIKQNTSMIHLTQGTAHGLVPEVMCGGECCLLPVNAAYDAVLVNAALGAGSSPNYFPNQEPHYKRPPVGTARSSGPLVSGV